ncbi:hypothetical protein DYH55_16360 [Methylovirgula sp. 4M-Z18]|nr:hypothetical protein DYH55_16360 [Methylovirgula sp. 4M-Z18]
MKKLLIVLAFTGLVAATGVASAMPVMPQDGASLSQVEQVRWHGRWHRHHHHGLHRGWYIGRHRGWVHRHRRHWR